MKKKKIFAIMLAVIMAFGLAACGSSKDTSQNKESSDTGNTENAGKTGDDSQSSAKNTPAGEKNSEKNSESNAPENKPGDKVQNAMIPGVVNLIKSDDRDSSVLRGVIIKGNQAGTSDGFNGRESSLTDVRCIFELNEWVEFYPDTDKETALRVWILKHRDDQEYYVDCEFSDLMPGFASYCDLRYPEDEENPDERSWGSFYLNPEECEPGYYDFVFTYEGKAIATMLTRFYNEAEIDEKSDEELEKIISSERNVAGGKVTENVFEAFKDAAGSDGDTWPTAEMWASVGLPALDYAESGENVSLLITNDSLSVTGYVDNETLADTLNDLSAMLSDAGFSVETVNSLTGGEQQVADYEYNGIPMQIRIGSNATAQVNIFVSLNR